MMIYHNYKNTISNIINKGVNILDGTLTFNITGIVYNKVVDCVINQNNRIINLNDNKCSINPNLLIDENDVEANHSALIGKFSDKELFYLMSRGIKKEIAINLLIKGFLTENILEKEKIEKIIDKYWR
jgi:Fe-S cluster assembly protein SufD